MRFGWRRAGASISPKLSRDNGGAQCGPGDGGWVKGSEGGIGGKGRVGVRVGVNQPPKKYLTLLKVLR